jgi:hypothetical protein
MDKVKFNKKLTIRLDEETYATLKEKTEELGLTQSEYLRQVILKGRATKKCKDLPALILHFSRIGNNLNQIARNLNIARKEGRLSDYDYDLLLDELMQINNNIKAILDDY